MAKNPDTPKKPSKTPKSKAHRPDVQPIGPALAELLNPAINRGDAGMGSGTGLQPPPDNSKDRRSGGEAALHRARASTRGSSDDVAKRDASLPSPAEPARGGLGESPQREFAPANYGTAATIPTLDPELAKQLGFTTEEEDARRDGAAAAQQDGGARRRRHRRRAGKPDPRRPPRVQGRGRPGQDLDAASPAAPGKIRRRRAAS